MHFSWPSPSIPILASPDSPIKVATEEEAYIVIANPIGDIIGAPLAASVADFVGRKTGLLLITIPVFISWITIAFANSTLMLCVARLISGLGDGMLFIFLPMYIGEVAEPSVRGILGCSLSTSMLVGMLGINAFGPYLSIRDTALISSVIPILFVITFFWMPESPYYLVMKGKIDEAKDAFVFLRRSFKQKEFDVLVHDVRRQMSEQGTLLDLFKIKSNRKALCIMSGLRTMQQFSGVAVLTVFSQSIFAEATDGFSPVLATVLYILTQLLVTLFGSILVEKIGRKAPLMVSCFGSGVILTLIGAYFYIDQMTSIDTSHVYFLSIILLMLYILIFGIGLGTIPSLMLGELFSASIKSKALCIMCIYYSFLISVLTKLFHFLRGAFGIHVPFFTFGICCFLNTFLAYYFVPETKGKSLEDIQQYLKGNKTKTET